MRSIRHRIGLPIAAVLALFAAPGQTESPAEPTDTDTRAPILIELFTSQGCSSCPPADRLLSELGERDDVVALAYHVDYWNYIGWTDPFSAQEWSERQRAYAQQFGSSRIYTPQLVVNGRWEGVGSNRREVERLLARGATAEPATRLDLDVVSEQEGRVDLLLRAETATAEGAQTPAWLAVVESGFATPVGRGENARKTLRNDNVVRRLEQLGAEWSNGKLRAEIALDPSWKRQNLRLVAFLQERPGSVVDASAAAELSSR